MRETIFIQQRCVDSIRGRDYIITIAPELI
jgi:hypothetical protein